jgi:3-deoxy-D-manno-octulosonate 8-phosphate phosphatase (KDO 8-P phosphatase)
MSEPSQSDFQRISTFIFDVDGVLTDGALLAFASGEQARAFNIKDGYAIRHAIKKGYRVAVISGREEVGVRKRLESLDIKEIYLGVEDKLTVFDNYVYYHDLDPVSIAYMGDDLPDLEVMLRCGMAACPADAALDILDISHYVATADGGKGAVRELIETIMKAQHRW